MDSYKDIFGANATFHFNQASNKMCSEIDFLEQSLALANPVASLAAERQCMEKLDEFSGKEGIISLIRDQLLEEIDHFPSLDEVAQNLHTSVSTLKRKLSEHQTSYQTILDDVRKELALKYLNQNQLTIDDIAQKLQFKEASNFRRAFKKWTGKTPSEYRTS